MSQAKIKIAEIFHSLQGEGRYVGVPSVFIRTFGCNFKCSGFGMPIKQLSTESNEIAEQRKDHPEWTYETLPLAKTGCDSYASWHPKFKDLSNVMTIDQIIQAVELSRLTHEPVRRKNALKETHIVITGGEPLLGWQRAYPELLDKLAEAGYRNITFETNGTQEISGAFEDYLLLNDLSGKRLKFTFSVSPKLSCSGETQINALKPEVVDKYQTYGEVYLKFVISQPKDLDDVDVFMANYKKAGFRGDVYIMPVGGTAESYNLNAPTVAQLAMHKGFIYSPRLQVDLWQNAWGT